MNLADFLLGRNASHSKCVSHAGSLANRVRNTVKQAELHRQVLLLLSHSDREAGLVGICHYFLVHCLKVRRQFNWLVVPNELVCERSDFEVDIIDTIGALVAPVGDNRAT